MRTVQLWRIGSDPELLFVEPRPGGLLRIPAQTYVGDDRQMTLRSFIGCDGHAQTAELRPPPCHNVVWHMMKIANAISQIKKHIPDQVRLLAQPALDRETLGGHIWVSLYYNSPMTSTFVHGYGVIQEMHGLMASQQILRSVGRGLVPLDTTTRHVYTTRANQGTELSADMCWMKLHYLIEPLEMLLFGSSREMRANGVNDPYFRVPNSGPDNFSYRPGQAYFRFEYRFPSTWLASPVLAHAYLGLAKLAVLNWDSLPSYPELLRLYNMGPAARSRRYWREVLFNRLHTLQQDKMYRITPDLKMLFTNLKEVTAKKISAPLFINTEAWEHYNYEGE